MGLAGAAILLLSAVVLCVVLTPSVLLAYLLYSAGWLIVGHGLDVWGFRLNSSYATALYPFAYYCHWLFWRVCCGGIVFRGKWVEIVGKVLTFLVFAGVFIGLWYMLGLGLEDAGLKVHYIDTSLFDGLQNVSRSYFAVAIDLFIAVAYLSVSYKLLTKLIKVK